MADQYNSAHTGAEIDQAVSDVQNNKAAWSSKPQPSTTTPKAPGTASAGSESAYARGDHVHPNEVVIFEASAPFDYNNMIVGAYELTYSFTYADILSAYSAGKSIFICVKGRSGVRKIYPLAYFESDWLEFIVYDRSFQLSVTGGGTTPFKLYAVNDFNTRLNRTTNVNAADANYTTYMARGEALFSTETTPTVNGCIAWQYG